VQSVGGGFLVVDGDPTGLDALRFYVGARTGIDQIIGNASVGMATLRRDGFTSLEVDSTSASGSSGAPPKASAVTNTLIFSESRTLMFVNVGMKGGQRSSPTDRDAAASTMTVAIIDPAGVPIPPFTADNCEPISADSVRQRVRWKGASDLSAVTQKPVKLRFELSGPRVQLFSFWVSQSECGQSNGYVAAGGKGFTGMTDTNGSCDGSA
jgi:hypothetical protein